MNPVNDLASICKQLEAMSLVDKPIQLTGKQADDVQKVERVLQEALMNPVGATAAERTRCRVAVQEFEVQLKVFTPRIREFQDALNNRKLGDAYKIASDPAIFRAIQAAAVHLKLNFTGFYTEFLWLKASFEKYLPLLQNAEVDKEEKFLWKMALLSSEESYFVVYAEEFLKPEERTPFITGCLQKAKLFRLFDVHLQMGDDFGAIGSASVMLRQHPKSERDTCVDYAKRKYANNPIVLTRIKIAADHVSEDILAAFHLN